MIISLKRMKVINRHNIAEQINFEQIKIRISKLTQGIEQLNIDQVVLKTIQGIYDNITTRQLDNLSAQICTGFESQDYLYGLLGGRILVDDLHKQLTNYKFIDVVNSMNQLKDFLDEGYVQFVQQNQIELEEMIDYSRDYNLYYFGFKTLERGYLVKVKDNIIERPQDMWMRVAIGLHYKDELKDELKNKLQKIKETYDAMSLGYMTHATPTLFNAGQQCAQCSSCFVLGTQDSLEGIFKTITDCAKISKWAGGIGLHISNIRGKGSYIQGTNGKSDGIIPMLKVYNETAKYINQSGKRNGSVAVYLEPWHIDIQEFVELKRNTGIEQMRTRDLFLALWVNDIFMQAVQEDQDWYLMCPNECPLLCEKYGQQFNDVYKGYVNEKKYRKVIKAQQLWKSILQSQIETGVPYILYKDNVNQKSNQKNIGIIKSSNLCAEIMLYSDTEQYAVCNLASIAVNKFYKDKQFDYELLGKITRLITYNLNRLIDDNYYPTNETRISNERNRPIGIGIQGLANLLAEMKIGYETQEACELDQRIMETIYFNALQQSCELAQQNGVYETYEGSPLSQGLFQFDLWKIENKNKQPVKLYQDWDSLREKIKQYGVRNSTVTALMPTASTSQILGNNECFEPFSSNIFKRSTLAGEFIVVNKHLQDDLVQLNLWNQQLVNEILKNNGSIQNIDIIPQDVRILYKTVWEIKQKSIIDHALYRAPFVDQSQSMNLFFDKPEFQKISSALFYGWQNGLKTGCYYLRSKPAQEAIKYGICDRQNKDCIQCSS